MTAIAERISNELLPLPEKDQEEVLHEVWERLRDLRAKKIHDAVQSGDMESYDSREVIADLRKKHAL
jgi:diphthamide synthase (EF-2-diphthine--ammonia ligase)